MTAVLTQASAAGEGREVAGGVVSVARRSKRRAILSIVLGLVVWELVGQFILTNDILFAPFSQVMAVLWHFTVTGEIWHHLWVSASEFFIGFGSAMLCGIAIGVLMGRFQLIRDYVDPWVSIFYSSPLVALIPLYLMAFGVGLLSKIAIIFTVSIFPVLLNTYVGVRSTDRNLLDVGQSFSCNSFQTFTKIEIPAALPFIMTGIRLSIGRGLTGVVVGELFSSQAGIGFVIAEAGQRFDAATVLMGVLLFTLAGLFLMGFLAWLTNVLAPWRASVDQH